MLTVVHLVNIDYCKIIKNKDRICDMPQTQKQSVGNTGENIACKFLEKRGFRIVERNYRKKWGEIDIIAEKDGVLHFVEVKASAVRGDNDSDYRPEENIRLWKKQRMSRAIRTYFAERKIQDDNDFQIDVMAILLDLVRKKAKIKLIKNVLL